MIRNNKNMTPDAMMMTAAHLVGLGSLRMVGICDGGDGGLALAVISMTNACPELFCLIIGFPLIGFYT